MRGKEKRILIASILLIILGLLSNLYINLAKEEKRGGIIEIDGKEIYLKDIFNRYELVEIRNNITGKAYVGIPLEHLIMSAGVKDPENHEYTIVGSDGYKKTVTWDNILQGVLTKERRVAFKALPKAFMVKDVVRIEVVG